MEEAEDENDVNPENDHSNQDKNDPVCTSTTRDDDDTLLEPPLAPQRRLHGGMAFKSSPYGNHMVANAHFFADSQACLENPTDSMMVEYDASHHCREMDTT
jgi:hypothetical protein